MATLSPATLQVHLLGAFRLESGGRGLRLGSRKAELLLAYVLLHPEPHSREKLGALLWPEAAAERVAGSLRTTLNLVRQQTGPTSLLADRQTVQFNPDQPVWVDVRALAAPDLVPAAWGAAPDQPDWTALYPGDLLADFYDEWIAPLREHYRRLYVERLLGLTQALRAQSEYQQAVRVAEAVLQREPGNEVAHQHLIFCHLAAGDRAAAIAQYERCRAALRREFEAEPLPETQALYQWIRQAAAPTPSAARPTNLPVPLSSLVGRARELAEIRQRLAPAAPNAAVRLLTLTGPGGGGKSRLAVQAGLERVAAQAYPDGVWWVELAAVRDGVLAPQAVARALGAPRAPQRSTTEGLIEFLRPRRLLLIVDNCEHLVAACAALCDRLLGACPDLQILTTSREPLGLTGEVVFPVPPLSLPPAAGALTLASLQPAEGAQLFLARAREEWPELPLRDADADAIAHICRRLDGLPLAIELAAARVRVLAVADIAARLDDAFRLLSTGSRVALPRQQTLRATLDWSYDLLAPPEQAALRALAVFTGSFGLAAAEAVIASAGPAAPVLDVLDQLVHKSLVQAQPSAAGSLRYHLLETVRQYARARLDGAGETRAAEQRHLAYYGALAASLTPTLNTPDRTPALDQLDGEDDNLRAALTVALAEPAPAEAGLALAGGLWRYWWLRGRYGEGRRWLERALAAAPEGPPSAPRAMALFGLGALCHLQADYAAARAAAEPARACYQALGDEPGQAGALNILGLAAHETGDDAQAAAYLEASLALFERAGDGRGAANARNNLGHIYMEGGAFDQARRHIEQSAALRRAEGDQQGLAYCLYNLGEIALRQAHWAEAQRWHEQCLAVRRRLGDPPRVAWSLMAVGRLLARHNDLAEATAHLHEAVGLFRAAGERLGLAEALLTLGGVRLRDEAIPAAQAAWLESAQLFEALGRVPALLQALAGLGAAAASDGPLPVAVRLLAAVAHFAEQPAGRSVSFDFSPTETIKLARAQMRAEAFELAWADGQALAAQGLPALLAYAADVTGGSA